MPELPEVETIRIELIPHVLGQQFTGVTIYDPKLVSQPAVGEFGARLIGQKINGLNRRGKFFIFHLSSNEVLIMHLRMTGALLLNPQQIDRYARAAFELDNTNQLIFSDRRRLGRVWLAENDRTINDKLGPEPLSDDFTVDVLAQRLKGRQAPVKAVLLDQTFIAGIGNMYADEALFSARIHPMTRAGSLSYSKIKALHSAIVSVLRSAISSGGASVDTYKRPGGESGTAHFGFKVAHRLGEPCPVCGTNIERLMIRNRGSYLCPYCQKELIS